MSEQKLYRIILVTLLAIIPSLVVPALVIFANGNRLHRKYWRAVRALEGGYHQDAAADLDYCLKRRPHDAEGFGRLWVARFLTGDYQGALEAFGTYQELAGFGQRDDITTWGDYIRARAHGTQPVGMTPWWVTRYCWRTTPQGYGRAQDLLRKAVSGRGGYAEAAELFEACLGKMPGKPGDVDALWGMAIARFHAGDLEGSLEALGRIRARWGKEPSDEFEAVVEYVKSCVPGEPAPLGMPLVLRAAATYAERKRQTGTAEE